MSSSANSKLIGRWRIVEADIWDRDYLDLCGPATITITDQGRGEIAFGALQAGLDIEYSRSSVGFTWEGFDEMDQVSGDGSAELLDDGSIEIELAYHNGDEAVLKAKRDLLQQPASVHPQTGISSPRGDAAAGSSARTALLPAREGRAGTPTACAALRPSAVAYRQRATARVFSPRRHLSSSRPDDAPPRRRSC
jgi:hypothetical protein